MNLNNVALAMTAGLVSQLPGKINPHYPQIALCGRSNVGKSSLINKLLGRKSLARVSSEPGKTITINYYEVDKTLYLVDLPGYGYAKRSFSERNKWKALIDKYFSLDSNILYLQLVDLKAGVTKNDEEMISFLVESELPFAIVCTKTDKLNKTNRNLNLEAIRNNPAIPEDVEIIPFSSQTGEGRDDVWNIIREYCDAVKESASEE